jgi:hypothetical protein
MTDVAISDAGAVMAPRRWSVPQVVLAILIVLMVVVTQFFSHAPRMLTNRPWVVKVADLPARANLEQLHADIDAENITIPKKLYSPPLGLEEQPAPTPESQPMLGYSIREVSLLGMPLLAYRENGYVLYIDGPDWFETSAIDGDRLKLLETQAGVPLSRGFSMPFWQYGWGWLLIIMIAAWLALEVRARIRQRAQTGIL